MLILYLPFDALLITFIRLSTVPLSININNTIASSPSGKSVNVFLKIYNARFFFFCPINVVFSTSSIKCLIIWGRFFDVNGVVKINCCKDSNISSGVGRVGVVVGVGGVGGV